jgi:hypothetical protein
MQFSIRAKVCTFVILLLSALNAVAQPKVFFSSGTASTIIKADLDGSNAATILTGVTIVYGIELDTANRKIYWTDQSAGTVERANFDGTSREVLISGISAPEGLALNVSANKMYFTAGTATRAIFRADLDGSNISVVINSRGGVFHDLDIDTTNGKLYWTEGSDKTIYRVNLDGSNDELLLDDSKVLASDGAIEGIALDVANGIIYYNTGNSIRKANLDGTNESEVFTLSSFGEGLAYDALNKRLYVTLFSDNSSGLISTALDGSDVKLLATTHSSVYGVAVNPEFRIVTPGTPLEDAPFPVVTDTTVRIIMEEFKAAALNLAAARLYGTTKPTAAAVRRKGKLGVIYQNIAGRIIDETGGPAVGREMRKRKSKRNVLTLRHLPNGVYVTRYRVLITRTKNGKTRVVGKTGYSPDAQFTIAQ